MPHTTQPGTLVALNYESYPTAPSTGNIFADLSRIWAASHPAGARPPEPLPLPPPIFPGQPAPGGPTACAQACLAECEGLRGSGPAYNACVTTCQRRCPGGAPSFGTLGVTPGQEECKGVIGSFACALGQFSAIIAVIIGIILVLIAVALIVR